MAKQRIYFNSRDTLNRLDIEKKFISKVMVIILI